MDKQEYIILNKTALEKMREELNKGSAHWDGVYVSDYQQGQIDLIDVIISSQSTPLIPEIEKAFTKGERYGWDSQKSIGNIGEMKEKIKPQSLDNYIANLKLDI